MTLTDTPLLKQSHCERADLRLRQTSGARGTPVVVAAAKVPSGWRPRMLPVNSPGAGGSTCSREWPGSFLRLMNPDKNHGRPWIREEMNELVRFVSLPSWAEVFLSEAPAFWSWLHGVLVYFSLYETVL